MMSCHASRQPALDGDCGSMVRAVPQRHTHGAACQYIQSLSLLVLSIRIWIQRPGSSHRGAEPSLAPDLSDSPTIGRVRGRQKLASPQHDVIKTIPRADMAKNVSVSLPLWYLIVVEEMGICSSNENPESPWLSSVIDEKIMSDARIRLLIVYPRNIEIYQTTKFLSLEPKRCADAGDGGFGSRCKIGYLLHVYSIFSTENPLLLHSNAAL